MDDDHQVNHMRRFYFCALFTLTLPIVMHVFAIYHLIEGIKKGEKLRPLYIVFSFGILLFTGFIGVYFVTDYLLPKIAWFLHALS